MRELAELLGEKKRRHDRTKLDRYRPYAKQRAFHEAGATYRERLLRAGNQLGKTFAGAAEMAMHLTGRYPAWWKGRRFDHAIQAIAGSESTELTRKGVQTLLVGPPETESEWGTGTIPGDSIVDWSRRVGTPNALDSVSVKHESGGISTLLFQAYEQGRSKWQALTAHLVWFDEEPPLDIYTEGLTRTNATDGIVFMTFTPLFGMSEVVRRFLMERSDDRSDTNMVIEDAEHIKPDKRAQIIASYPAHEREARVKGIPILGSGRIFPIAEEQIICEPVGLEDHWAQIIGVDFGTDHPFAAVHLAWDRDADVIYVVKTHRVRQQTPILHAASVRPWGEWIPVAWPHDGLQHDKGGSGEQLAAQYRDQKLNMLHDHATHEEGGYGTEAGVLEMLDRMQTGRLKVFKGLNDWFEEFRLYHRKDGKIVKELDDLMSATRYAIMMKRFAEVPPRKRKLALGRAVGWQAA